jgi:ribosomal protein L7/L12
MNGYLNRNATRFALYSVADEIQAGPAGDVHIEDVAAKLVDFLAEQRRKANMSLEVAATEAVAELGTERKIQAIKQVRELTGAGLKEAKDAVEVATVIALRDQAEAALKALAQANERVTYGQRRTVWVHAENVTGAVDTSPF